MASGTDNDSISSEQCEENSDPSEQLEVDRKSSETVTLENSQNDDVVEKKNEEGPRINNKSPDESIKSKTKSKSYTFDVIESEEEKISLVMTSKPYIGMEEIQKKQLSKSICFH